MLIRAAEPQPREYLCCLSSLYTPLVYRLGKYPVAQTVEKQQDPRLNILFCCSIVRLGFCMNNFLVLLTLRVRLTGLHS